MALCGCTVFFSTSGVAYTAPPGHAAYVARANSICARYNAEDARLTSDATARRIQTPDGQVGILGSSRQQQAWVAREIDIVGLQEIQALRGIPPVPVEAQTLDAIYAEGVEELELAEDSILPSDPAQAGPLVQQAVRLGADVNRRLIALGLGVCAQ